MLGIRQKSRRGPETRGPDRRGASALTPTGAIAAALLLVPPADSAPVDFNRDIRPLLSDRCFKCHGFDPDTREAGLRLDTAEGAHAPRKNGRAVTPGDPSASLLWQRINSPDRDEVMPPPDSHLSLNSAERELLRRWIEDGAPYAKHWALLPVDSPPVPEAGPEAVVRNEVDAFVAQRLKKEGLSQSPEASRHTLIRRLSLDLRGLPPSIAETGAFIDDDTPEAYERMVDRFLASPAYGERMAWPWLNAARYADSNGYQGDNERTMWPWRDWVVDAFNRNIPWDELTVWQLAGDLLPDATFEQKLATGFLRNHPINGEGGRIAEENRVDYVMDMTETTGTVWLGLTFNCCRCHDHKYDPLTQEEYYRLGAFFNQTPVDGGGGNPQTPPVIAVPDGQQEARETKLVERLAGMRAKLAQLEQDLAMEQAAWEKTVRQDREAIAWHVPEVLSAEAGAQKTSARKDGTVLASGPNPDNDTYTIRTELPLGEVTGIRLEALRHKSMTQGGLARSDSGNFVLTGFEAALSHGGRLTALEIVSGEATFEQGGFKIDGAIDADPETGWAVHEGRFVGRDHEAVFRLAGAAAIPEGTQLVVTMRHDSKHKRHNLGHFRLSLTDAAAPRLDDGGAALQLALSTTPPERGPAQRKLLAEAHRRSRPEHGALQEEIRKVTGALSAIRKAIPKVMVMADGEKPRKTFLLEAGLYDKPGKEVSAGTPASLPAFRDDLPPDRLGLARWLVSPENPLPARVTVNRLWQELFGTGIVKTPENFGVQSDTPVHGELLDWLAAEFVESGWDVKALVRTIVTSHTYRQSSRLTPALRKRDPGNRFLGRGARYRMPAWMIRDQALAASGLLVDRRGGPPVKTYQPPGLWAEATFGKKKYERDNGEALYRRSLYTFWRRIAAPPMFFDNPGRETCAVKDGRTNTPLHALSTLNDVTYVEAARALASRAGREAGPATRARLARAFRLALARPPSAGELDVLEASCDRALDRFASDPAAARDFLANGESPRNSELPEAMHAALASVCLGILNLDETLTRE